LAAGIHGIITRDPLFVGYPVTSNDPVLLKRGLGFWLLLFYGVGNILGAGIYVLIGKVAAQSGYFVPLSFLLAAFVAAFSAFTYAELSARYPFAAGEAVFLQQGFGIAWLSSAVGLLIACAGVVSAATIARGFVGYLQLFVAAPQWLVIVVLLLLLGAVAVWGIAESVKLAALFTLLEVLGLLLIVVAGGSALQTLPELAATLPSLTQWHLWPGIFLGAILAFYAFIGFEDMVNVAEEVRNPEKNMPRAIIAALLLTMLLYALVSVVAVVNLAPPQLAASKAPLADVYSAATGRKPVLISVISLFAIVNGALVQIIMASRIIYGMSRQGWLPACFGRVSQRTRTPVEATLLVTALIMALALWFPLVKLAASTSYLILTVFLLVNLALIRVRAMAPLPPGVKGYPAWVPVTGAAGSLFLLLVQIIYRG
jgi:APA family basic amino acid/polyamine antiporter